MNREYVLIALWALLALGGTLCFFILYRFLKASRRSEHEQPERNLFVEAIQDQAILAKKAREERDLSDQALKDLDLTYRAVTQHIPVCLLVFDTNGRIQLMNPQFQKVFSGFPEHHETLDDLPLVLCDEIKFLMEAENIREKRVEIAWQNQNHICDLSLVQLRTDQFLLTLQDKTRVTQLQRHLKIKSDLALIGELASGITHEVKNTLAILQGHIQLLTRQSGMKDNRNIQTMKEEINRLFKLIQQFMKSSEAPKLNKQNVSLRELYDVLAKAWEQPVEQGVLKLAEPDETISIHMDLDQVRNVLSNLILNSLEAIDQLPTKNGRVKLEWECDHPDRVVIHVTDTGAGISPAMMKNLFTPLITDKKKGSGLGLFQSKKLVQAHHGEIRVSQNPTRFSVSLPRQVDSGNGYIDDTI
ncbi:MAG: hypothetical protein CR997_03445 [Acidobacteria bacterium]|nr:MAG: hypothetical protein CR997_03445 [Acidobacteriota bacterium]